MKVYILTSIGGCCSEHSEKSIDGSTTDLEKARRWKSISELYNYEEVDLERILSQDIDKYLESWKV